MITNKDEKSIFQLSIKLKTRDIAYLQKYRQCTDAHQKAGRKTTLKSTYNIPPTTAFEFKGVVLSTFKRYTMQENMVFLNEM